MATPRSQRHRSPSFSIPPPLFGHLHLLYSKPKARPGVEGLTDISNTIPIEAPSLSIGRGDDCDVRIYDPTVSKVHCVLQFDLITEKATLVIHSTRGLQLNSVHLPPVPSPSRSTVSRPSSNLPYSLCLSEGDEIRISTKLSYKKFRFCYPAPLPLTLPGSPSSAAASGRSVQPVIDTPLKVSERKHRRQSTTLNVLTAESPQPLRALAAEASKRRAIADALEQGLPQDSVAALTAHPEEVDEEEGAAFLADVTPVVSPSASSKQSGGAQAALAVTITSPSTAKMDWNAHIARLANADFMTPQPKKKVLIGPPGTTIRGGQARWLEEFKRIREQAAAPAEQEEVVEEEDDEDQVEDAEVSHSGAGSADEEYVQDEVEVESAEDNDEAEDEMEVEEEELDRSSALQPKTPSRTPLPASTGTPYLSTPHSAEKPAYVTSASADDAPKVVSRMEQLQMSARVNISPSKPQSAAAAPKTPRSIPLPSGGATPYNATPRVQQTPRSVLRTANRGGLHRIALVQSARKRLEAQYERELSRSPQSPTKGKGQDKGSTSGTRSPSGSPTRGGIAIAHAEEDDQEDLDELEEGEESEGSLGGSEEDESMEYSVEEMGDGSLVIVMEDGHTVFGEDGSEIDLDAMDYDTDSDSDGEGEYESDDIRDLTGMGEIDFDEDEEETLARSAAPATRNTISSASLDKEEIWRALELARANGDVSDDLEVDRSLHVEDDSCEEDEEDLEEKDQGEDQQEPEDQTQMVADETPEEEDEMTAPRESAPVPSPFDYLPTSPLRAQPALSNFFTPQPPHRLKLNTGRKSTSGIVSQYGPPVRFARVNAVKTIAQLNLGPPVRPMTPRKVVKDDDTIAWAGGALQEVRPGKVENERERAERLHRRRSLATPRSLPKPPKDGFLSPAKASPQKVFFPPASLQVHRVQTPIALRPVSDDEAPSTPVQALMLKNKRIHRASVHRLSMTDAKTLNDRTKGRRATVGFASPSTPAANGRVGMPKARTGTPGHRFSRMSDLPPSPASPSEHQHIRGGGIKSSDDLRASTASMRDINPVAAEKMGAQQNEELAIESGEDAESAEDEDEAAPEEEEEIDEDFQVEVEEAVQSHMEMLAATPASVQTTPIRPSHDSQTKAVATPSMAGLRQMFNLPKATPPTPNFSGLKDMMRPPALSYPQTPNVSGVSQMFALHSPGTPILDGVEELFAEHTPVPAKQPTVAAPASAQDEATEEDVIAVMAKPAYSKSKAAASTKSTKSAPTATRTRRIPAVDEVEPVAPIAKRGRTKSADDQPVESVLPAPKATRGKKAVIAPVEEALPAAVEEQAVEPKTGPKPRARVAATKSVPAPRATKSRATKAISAAVSAEIQLNDEEVDRLDSMEVPPEEAAQTAPVKATRGKAAAAKSAKAVSKAAKSSPVEIEEAEIPKPKARATTGRGKTTQPAPEPAEEAVSEEAPAPAAKRKAASTAAARKKAVEADEVPEAPAPKRKAKSFVGPATEAPPAPVKATRAPAKKPVAAPKEAAAEAPKRATRARK